MRASSVDVHMCICDELSLQMPSPKWEYLYKAWYTYHCTRDSLELRHSLLDISKRLQQNLEDTNNDAIRVHMIAFNKLRMLHQFYKITEDYESVLSPRGY